MQEISAPQENYEHLSKLELADFDDVSSELSYKSLFCFTSEPALIISKCDISSLELF